MNSSFEKELAEKGFLVYHNVGDSMMPLVKQGRDLMLLRVPNREYRKYDAVLYKRENGQYVMHRIIGSNSEGFIMCGDNRYDKEYGIKKEQVMALLTAVVRDGKELSTDSVWCKIYVHLWCDLFFIRKIFLKFKIYFYLLKRKFTKCKKKKKI